MSHGCNGNSTQRDDRDKFDRFILEPHRFAEERSVGGIKVQDLNGRIFPTPGVDNPFSDLTEDLFLKTFHRNRSKFGNITSKKLSSLTS